MLQIIGVTLFHDSPAQVAIVQAVVVGLVLLGNELRFHRILFRPRDSSPNGV